MKNYLAEQGGISEGNVCMTDGSFFEDMRAKERKILEEIDPKGLKEFDRIDAEREAQEVDVDMSKSNWGTALDDRSLEPYKVPPKKTANTQKANKKNGKEKKK